MARPCEPVALVREQASPGSSWHRDRRIDHHRSRCGPASGRQPDQPSIPPSAPLAIVGSASPGVQPTNHSQGAQYSGALGGTSGADPCSLSGTYVLPGAVHLPKTVSTEDITRMLEKAGYANETSGSYLLQPSAGQTAVLTGLHTVLLRRVPAATEKATVLYIESLCPGAPLTMYDASIDLDAANLTPRLSLINEMSGTTTPVRNLADVTTEDQPVQINFNATTTKYDVTWKLRVDYVVNGKAESAYVPSAGQPFETDAVVSSDPAYTLWLNGSDAWSVQSGNPSTPPSPTTPSPTPTLEVGADYRIVVDAVRGVRDPFLASPWPAIRYHHSRA
jgi:hypothetical protein